jgi:excisionase family DNA binding protein
MIALVKTVPVDDLEAAPLLALDKPLYSIPEAAAALRIGRSTLYRQIKDHRIRTRKIGWRTVIRRDDLEKLIEAGQ